MSDQQTERTSHESTRSGGVEAVVSLGFLIMLFGFFAAYDGNDGVAGALVLIGVLVMLSPLIAAIAYSILERLTAATVEYIKKVVP